MSTSLSSSPRTTRPSVVSAVLTLIVVAVALNTLVAAVAVNAGASATFPPLTFPAYTTFTVIGVIVGWIGWRIVQRRAANPRRVLSILVPAVALVSFIPDLLLLWLDVVPGTTVAGVIALMVMHVVVIAVAVPGYIFATRTRT